MFLVDIDKVARFGLNAAFRQVVVVEEFAEFHVILVGNVLIGIADDGHNIVKVVAALGGMPQQRSGAPVVFVVFVGALGNVLVEAVGLNQIDEFLGIKRVGGISALFKPSGPPSIVVDVEQIERSISLGFQESGVVEIGIVGRAVFSVAGLSREHAVAFPAVALDAKVVVAFAGKFAGSRRTFEQSLRQGYASRNAVFALLN